VRKSKDQKLSDASGSDQGANGAMNDSENFHDEPSHDEAEDVEWTGTGFNVPSTSKKPEQGIGKPTKPPTGEELRVIKDATDLFKSNSFKLQVCIILPFAYLILNTSFRLMLCCQMFVLNPPERCLSNGSFSHYTLL